MKNRIRLKLIAYFAGSFLIFAVIIALVFYILLSQHNMNVHKQDMQNHAESIAATMSEILENTGHESPDNETTTTETNTHGQGQGQGAGKKNASGQTNPGQGNGSGYGAYMRFLDSFIADSVWIVDRDLQQIKRGHNLSDLSFESLPEDAESVVDKAYAGEVSFSESFTPLQDSPTITVAAPITLSSGTIAGAVLLHSQIEDIALITESVIPLLAASIAAGLVIAILVACILAAHFTKPLEKMKNAAVAVSQGDFTTPCNVTQKDEIGELAEALKVMTEKLDTASQERNHLDKLRRDFAANTSHELRTPVTVIRGSLEALTDGVVSEPDQVHAYHQQMLQESIHLERMVADLLDLAKLQNPDYSFSMNAVELGEILSDAIRSMASFANDKAITVNLHSDNRPAMIHGDYGRLRQMFIIIINNAIKFSPPESTVEVSILPTDNQLCVTIADEGKGIAPEDLPFIFDRFIKDQSKDNQSGTGIGLAIAKEIADRHHIQIAVDSTEGRGTIFAFQFKPSLQLSDPDFSEA